MRVATEHACLMRACSRNKVAARVAVCMTARSACATERSARALCTGPRLAIEHYLGHYSWTLFIQKKKMTLGIWGVTKIKAVGAGLDGYMEWVDSIASDPAEEREDDMSSLAVEFVARMRKRATSSQEETTPGSEVSHGKCSIRFSPNEGA